MACRPLVSLNRQEAEIAAERFALSQDVEGFGAEWVQRFAAPVIVRQDKDGAWYFSAQTSGCVPAFQRRSLILSAQETATPAACWPD
jgi:sugar/nucleoside kinase (ribokinase family)